MVVSGESGIVSLVKWVQSVAKEDWGWEVFDFEMLGDKVMEEEMVGLMQVALLCVATLPKDRPKMSMVNRMIEDIGTKVSHGVVGIGLCRERHSFPHPGCPYGLDLGATGLAPIAALIYFDFNLSR
ncbi:hypothetical protein CCACVL1_20904, partial [Corchorus capsularis]